MAVPLRREDYDHRASYAGWQDDLLYESAPRFTIEGNLAAAPQTTLEPTPITRPISRRKALKAPARQLSGSAKLLILSAIILFAAAFLVIAMNSNRVYTARQELEQMENQLDNARAQTAVLRNEQEEEIPLNELYTYATTYLGMQEVTKDDITYLESLQEVQTTTAAEPETEHQPTRVSFHLFG